MESLGGKKDDVKSEIWAGIKEDLIVGTCPVSGHDLRILRAKKSRKRFVGCSGYPECRQSYPLPQYGEIIALKESCEYCGSPRIKVVSKGKRPWSTCLNMECPSRSLQQKPAEEETPEAAAVSEDPTYDGEVTSAEPVGVAE